MLNTHQELASDACKIVYHFYVDLFTLPLCNLQVYHASSVVCTIFIRQNVLIGTIYIGSYNCPVVGIITYYCSVTVAYCKYK